MTSSFEETGRGCWREDGSGWVLCEDEVGRRSWITLGAYEEESSSRDRTEKQQPCHLYVRLGCSCRLWNVGIGKDQRCASGVDRRSLDSQPTRLSISLSRELTILHDAGHSSRVHKGCDTCIQQWMPPRNTMEVNLKMCLVLALDL
jgi:hypothetical protein